MSVEIKLCPDEYIVFAQAGVIRQWRGRTGKAPPAHGCDPNAPWDLTMDGMLAEAAVAKYLNRYPSSVDPKADADVGRYTQVRSTRHAGGRLLLHDKDEDDHAFVLVLTHAQPVFILAGWITGEDGKTEDYWATDMPRPCYAVSQSELRDMDELFYLLNQPEVKDGHPHLHAQ